jgi:hypothetical protein
MYVTCYFCEMHMLRDDAIEAGWAPEFWEVGADVACPYPVCPACLEEHCAFDEEYGDYVKKGD